MTAENKPNARSFEREIEIRAPVDVVWRALTDAAEIMRWFAFQASVEPQVGGTILWSWGEPFIWKSRIEVWEPNRRLRAVYDSPPAAHGQLPPAVVVMDFTLEARGGNTLLHLVQSGFGAGAGWDDEYDGTSRGWWVEFRNLRHYLENHRGEHRSVAWIRQPISLSCEEAWMRLSSPQGLAREGSLAKLREGDRYSITAATGDTFAGVVHIFGPPLDFSGTVENLNNGLLRAGLEKLAGQWEALVWLTVYDRPEAEVEAFRERWQRQLQLLFAEPMSQPKESRR